MGELGEDHQGYSDNKGADKIKWVLEKSGQYTTRSMYRMLTHRGVVNYRMRTI